MDTGSSFECFCGDRFGDREALIEHNVASHDMTREESRSKVMEKYPAG